MSSDEKKAATYISAGFDQNKGATDFTFNDEINMGVLNINRSHTFQNFNLSYGGYGFIGNYNNKSTQPGPVDNSQQVGSAYFTSKAFSGFGLNASADYFTSTGRADWRCIGVELAYNKESGDYLNYRQTASAQPNIFTDHNSEILTAGISSEVIFHGSNQDFQYGFKLCLGSALGNHLYTNTSNTNTLGSFNASSPELTLSIYAQLHKYFLVLDAGDAGVIRAGYRF
jgi:hypothetical protein